MRPKVAAVAWLNWPSKHDAKSEPLPTCLKPSIHAAFGPVYPINLPTRLREEPVKLDVRNLEFTAAEGDIAHLKYQMQATPISAQDGRPRNLINGSWDVVGSTGKLKQLQGAGVLRVNVISPNERSWILEGELVQAP